MVVFERMARKGETDEGLKPSHLHPTSLREFPPPPAQHFTSTRSALHQHTLNTPPSPLVAALKPLRLVAPTPT
jgi:hypothetical protein